MRNALLRPRFPEMQWQDPWADRLELCYSFFEGCNEVGSSTRVTRNLGRGQSGSGQAIKNLRSPGSYATWVNSPWGPAFDCQNRAANDYLETLFTAALADFSIVFLGRPNLTGSFDAVFDKHYDDGPQCYRVGTTATELRLNVQGVDCTISGLTAGWDDNWVWIGGARQGGTGYLSIDGGEFSATTASFGTAATGTDRLGIFSRFRDPNSYATPGQCAGFFLWTRFIPQDELESHYLDPWRVIRPRTRKYFVAAAPAEDDMSWASVFEDRYRTPVLVPE